MRNDPIPAFCFKVTIGIDGCDSGQAFFKSVGGLKMETEVIEFRAGGVNDSTLQARRRHQVAEHHPQARLHRLGEAARLAQGLADPRGGQDRARR